jgi:thiol-disulfide isomerase/thioredoxin
MKSKLMYYTKEIVIFTVVMIIFANLLSLYKSSDLKKSSFNLVNIELIDGTKFKVDENKPLLVHFWATWCPTCKAEASNIDTVSNNFQVLTIAVKSGNNEDIFSYLKDNEYSFKTLNDNSGVVSSEFNIAAFPTTFIYDKNKKLVFSEVGYTSTWGLWLRMWWAGL